MWAIGVITYELYGIWSVNLIISLCGFTPFWSECLPEVFEKIMHGTVEFYSPHWEFVSTEAKDFISKLLLVKPAARMTARQAMKHPWFYSDE